MKKADTTIRSGPFKGKQIEFAPTTGIDMFREVAEDFMRRVFDFEPEAYFISDESSLFDFTGVEEMERKDIQQRIREVYDVDVSDLASGNLLEIFARLHYRRYGGPS
jgi:hypothetical protein